MVKPNFFLVGAPKCGTTSMARWLSEHPGIFVSVPKEPHYFSMDLRNRKYSEEARYLALFRQARPEHEAIGEASTWYLYSVVAVPAIERLLKEPRYIVMTRDPVEMVRSLYLHNVRYLYEDAPSVEVAWSLESLRQKGERIPAGCKEPTFLLYRQVCSVGRQLTRMLSHAPPSRVMHVGLGDLKENPAAEYERVLAFLGVPSDGRRVFVPENEARATRSRTMQRMIMGGGRLRRALGIRRGSGLLKLNEHRIVKEPVPADLAAEIRRELAEDQVLLGEAVRQLRVI